MAPLPLVCAPISTRCPFHATRPSNAVRDFKPAAPQTPLDPKQRCTRESRHPNFKPPLKLPPGITRTFDSSSKLTGPIVHFKPPISPFSTMFARRGQRKTRAKFVIASHLSPPRMRGSVCRSNASALNQMFTWRRQLLSRFKPTSLLTPDQRMSDSPRRSVQPCGCHQDSSRHLPTRQPGQPP